MSNEPRWPRLPGRVANGLRQRRRWDRDPRATFCRARDQRKHPPIIPIQRNRTTSIEGDAAHAARPFFGPLFRSRGARNASAHARSFLVKGPPVCCTKAETLAACRARARRQQFHPGCYPPIQPQVALHRLVQHGGFSLRLLHGHAPESKGLFAAPRTRAAPPQRRFLPRHCRITASPESPDSGRRPLSLPQHLHPRWRDPKVIPRYALLNRRFRRRRDCARGGTRISSIPNTPPDAVRLGNPSPMQMAVLAPVPSASERTATAVKPSAAPHRPQGIADVVHEHSH